MHGPRKGETGLNIPWHHTSHFDKFFIPVLLKCKQNQKPEKFVVLKRHHVFLSSSGKVTKARRVDN